MKSTIPIKTIRKFSADLLLQSSTVCVRDVYCPGTCSGPSAEEYATATELVFPYRGTYVRHLGQDQAVAEANQVLFFNAAEGYRVSHPVPGGDASLSLAMSPDLLLEMVPAALLQQPVYASVLAPAATYRCPHASARGDAASQSPSGHC